MTQEMTPLVHVMAQLITPQPGNRLIFTYDLLMHEDRFPKLCPSAWLVYRAKLLSRQFIFNQDGVATIVPCRGSVVHGLVWEISEQEQIDLEGEIGVPVTLDRYGAFARGLNQEMIAVEYYASRNHRQGEAKDPMEIVRLLAVANQWRFGDAYMTELAQWAPGPVEFEGPRLVQ
jgi:hypothetical protein